MVINEEKLFEILDTTDRAVLLEPPYKTQYIPLGLAKISAYLKERGAEVEYQREYSPINEDTIFMTTLFTYYSSDVMSELNKIYSNLFSNKDRVVVGGIFSSIMPRTILDAYPEVMLYKGCSHKLDLIVPDYETDWDVDPPWDEASYVFTTRGCPNRCPYCVVWRIEPEHYIIENWKEHVCRDSQNVIVSDNNISSFSFEHIKDVFEFFREEDLRPLFNNGFESGLITPEIAELAGSVKYFRDGMRVAFDRIEDDGEFQRGVKLLQEYGVHNNALMAYVMFNFKDTPQEAQYRMEECIRLNIRQYPMVYTPLYSLDKSENYVGRHWTWNLVRAFRFFYLMGGLYRNYKFDEWMQTAHTFDEDDYKHWDFEAEDFAAYASQKSGK